MGYLFPGLFVLYVIYYFHSLDWDFYQISNINNLGKAINRTGDKFNFEKSVLIIIIAYVIGHLISYTSSLTVEILSNRFFGYPSKYLLQEDRPKYSELWKNYFKVRIESSSKIWKALKKAISYIAYGFIFLLLFPVSVIIISLGYLLDINQFIVRPLDKYLINSIKIRQQELAKRIGLKLPDVGQECDYHRIIMHYVYLNIPACQHKVDNYIALYGFLRCMTFIFCVLFDVFFIFGIGPVTTNAAIWPCFIGCGHRFTPSAHRSLFFISNPPAYPTNFPFAPNTRWHGIIIDTGLRPTAPPTARGDVPRPMRAAMSP